ncbi:mCG1044135, isoform CRA_a, partial [Mus musculus]
YLCFKIQRPTLTSRKSTVRNAFLGLAGASTGPPTEHPHQLAVKGFRG